MFSDASEILARLLEGGHSTIAGRLAGAFRNIGRERIADDIVRSMQAADYTVREIDPFDIRLELSLPRRETFPMPDVLVDRERRESFPSVRHVDRR
jgi:hypothetical protein